jgi:RecJ-like exonuclease
MYQTCDRCDGRGYVRPMVRCAKCGGRGCLPIELEKIAREVVMRDKFEGVPDDVMDEYHRERSRTPFAQAYAEYQDCGVWPDDWDEDDEEADDEN